AARPWEAFGLEPGEYGLVTLHRPSLVDDPLLLAETVAALEELSRDVPLLFPVHPRTRDRLAGLALDRTESVEALQLASPLSYSEFLGVEAAARFVLTDSGGVQEETSALGVPCFTLRSSTERPVTIELGTNHLLGASPERIPEIPALLEARREPSLI